MILVHLCKMMIYELIFFIFDSFIFRAVREGRVKGQMMAQDGNKILSVKHHILHTSYDYDLWHKCVKR